jgi:hypothetical protein
MHWLIFAVPVLLAFGWRLSFDAGRSYQRKRMWDLDTAFWIDMGDKRLMLAEQVVNNGDLLNGLKGQTYDPYEDDKFAARVRHDWSLPNVHHLFGITGITA